MACLLSYLGFIFSICEAVSRFSWPTFDHCLNPLSPFLFNNVLEVLHKIIKIVSSFFRCNWIKVDYVLHLARSLIESAMGLILTCHNVLKINLRGIGLHVY